MGTLFDQPERNHRRVKPEILDAFLSDILALSEKHGIPVSDVIAANRVLELERANDLYVGNGDIFDEQIAGIGDILKQLAEAVAELKAD